MAADGELTSDEFAAFATDVVATTDYAALSFSELVPSADRSDWEESTGYEMHDLVDGQFVPSAERDTHVVVREVQPLDDLTAPLLGFDLQSEPTRASGIATALEDDEAVVGPISLARSQDPGVFVVRAVRDLNGDPIGFISAGLAADALLGQTDDESAPQIGLWIDGEQLLESPGSGATAEFEVAGRMFTVEANDPHDTSWLLPIIIGVSSFLLCAAALIALRRTRHDRERELRIANRNEQLSRLAAELAETWSTDNVVDIVIDSAHRVLGAELAEVGRIDYADGRSLDVVSERAPSTLSKVSRTRRRQSMDDGLPLSESARAGRVVTLTDGGDYERRHPAAREVGLSGIKTSICAPLSFGGQLSAGAVGFGWSRQMSEHELEDTAAAIQLLAQMAGRALDREVVRVAVQERVEQLRELAQLLSSARTTAEIQNNVAERLPNLLAIESAELDAIGDLDDALLRIYPTPHPRGTDVHLRLHASTDWTPTLEALTQAVVELIEAAWLRASDQEHEHDVLQRLTESLLLPAPTIDGLQIAVAYRSAMERVGIGGDWYSVIERDDVVHFVIGDVAGHGPGAVAIMAEAKSVLRHLLTAGTSLGGALEHAHEVLRRRDAFASVIAVSVDKRNEMLTYLNAGHPFPILRTPTGTTLLSELHRPWLGLEGDARPPTRVPFPVGSTLLLYSDGLVEDRRESIDISMERLVEKVTVASADPRVMVDAMLAEREDERSDTTIDDDIAVIAVFREGGQRSTANRRIELQLASTESARLARDALVSMLDGASQQSAQAVLLVASELVSNVIMHTDGPGVLRAWPDGQSVHIEVTDQSPQRLPTARLTDPSESHGRGLRLVGTLSRDWGVRVDATTKTVWADVALDALSV